MLYIARDRHFNSVWVGKERKGCFSNMRAAIRTGYFLRHNDESGVPRPKPIDVYVHTACEVIDGERIDEYFRTHIERSGGRAVNGDE